MIPKLLKTIDELTLLGLSEVFPTAKNENFLIKSLVAIQYFYFEIPHKIDNMEYPDPPERNYNIIKECVRRNFPDLGHYNIPEHITKKINKSKCIVGDAIDDITDIISDLIEIKWYFINTSKSNGIFNFRHLYEDHFGKHLVDLMYYLHHKNIE